MRIRKLLPAVVLVSLLAPASAYTGAPNYDCAIRGGHARLAIDQWRAKVVALGVGSHSTVTRAVADIVQDGPSLDFATTLAGTRWSVAIRGYGKSMTMTSPGSTLTGRCLFVPGNFVLRASDRGGFALRSTPTATATAQLSVRVGEPVWESPDAEPTGLWLPVRVIQANGLSLSSKNGWLRQIGPAN
jgi:hypothetical protein